MMSWKILRHQGPHLYSVEEEAENNKGFVEAEANVEDMTVAVPVDVILSTGMLIGH